MNMNMNMNMSAEHDPAKRIICKLFFKQIDCMQVKVFQHQIRYCACAFWRCKEDLKTQFPNPLDVY